MKTSSRGFTIVELLIVIVVIGILASIIIVAFNGVQQRAADTKRQSDMATLSKAIRAARINSDQSLGAISGSYWSMGSCIGTGAGQNPSAIEPKDLPKTHGCWVRYYTMLAQVGAAANMNLNGLREGDTRGNPYTFDENEGEAGDFCRTDSAMRYFTGDGITMGVGPAIPKYFTC